MDLSGSTSIKSVDLSGNTSIKSLNLAGSGVESVNTEGCENLESIDVSGCTSLTSLNVNSNPSLKYINAEGCINLEELDCANCIVEYLNLTGCISVKKIHCEGNSLYKFDAYEFPVLEDFACENQNVKGWTIGREFSFMDLDEFTMSMFAADGENTASSGVENITNLRAWDAAGNELTVNYDQETGSAEFSAEPAKIAYDYITGFEDVKMDVTVSAAGSENPSINAPGGSGGCDVGAAFSVTALALGLLLLRRKR